MTRPNPRSYMPGSAARMSRNGDSSMTRRMQREPLGLELLDGAHVLDAGVVHEDVGVEREVGERRRVAEVDRQASPPSRVGTRCGGLAVEVGDRHVRARRGERLGAGSADAARAAGHDRAASR